MCDGVFLREQAVSSYILDKYHVLKRGNSEKIVLANIRHAVLSALFD